ncbi:4418_t:CDS:2, partial [Cetraspora pellucida]
MPNKNLTTSYQPQINDTFESHDKFVNKIKSYAYNLSFTIRLGKSEHLKSENKANCLEKQIINIDLIHNYQMVEENYKFFMSNKWNILDNVK